MIKQFLRGFGIGLFWGVLILVFAGVLLIGVLSFPW